jgi:Uma2 family endonuclease
MATTKLVTIRDVEQLHDDSRYDLIRGELIRITPAGAHHGEYAANVLIPLGTFAKKHKAGKVYTAETGFILARDPDVLLAPDVAFVRYDRLPSEAAQEGFLELAPDLVVEIVSPSDRAHDVTAKVLEYLDAGVLLVWVVEPRRRIVTAYSADRSTRVLGIDEELDGDPALPGFRLPGGTYSADRRL